MVVDGGGYILAFCGWCWMMVGIFWLMVSSGGWWWMLVGGNGYILAGGGWWVMVVEDGGGWLHSLV